MSNCVDILVSDKKEEQEEEVPISFFMATLNGDIRETSLPSSATVRDMITHAKTLFDLPQKSVIAAVLASTAKELESLSQNVIEAGVESRCVVQIVIQGPIDMSLLGNVLDCAQLLIGDGDVLFGQDTLAFHTTYPYLITNDRHKTSVYSLSPFRYCGSIGDDPTEGEHVAFAVSPRHIAVMKHKYDDEDDDNYVNTDSVIRLYNITEPNSGDWLFERSIQLAAVFRNDSYVKMCSFSNDGQWVTAATAVCVDSTEQIHVTTQVFEVSTGIEKINIVTPSGLHKCDQFIERKHVNHYISCSTLALCRNSIVSIDGKCIGDEIVDLYDIHTGCKFSTINITLQLGDIMVWSASLNSSADEFSVIAHDGSVYRIYHWTIGQDNVVTFASSVLYPGEGVHHTYNYALPDVNMFFVKMNGKRHELWHKTERTAQPIATFPQDGSAFTRVGDIAVAADGRSVSYFAGNCDQKYLCYDSLHP